MKDPAQEQMVLVQLLNQQVSAVVFVQDYLQLNFDGKRLTVNVWPKLVTDGHELTFGETGYRDALCSLIGRTVVDTSESETELVLKFDVGRVTINLIDDTTMEHVIFEDTATNAWAWW